MENNPKKRIPAVIDLLWDSSDDETDSKPKARASKTTTTKQDASKPVAKKSRKASSLDATSNKKARSNCNSPTTTKSNASLPHTTSFGGGTQFNVATYNIWFGPPHPDDRMMALSQALLAKNTGSHPLWFVGFQEVTPILWVSLKPFLESAGYRVFCQDLGGQYGCALAVLQTSGLKIIQHGFQPYRKTIMGRGFLHVRAQLPNSQKQVLFTTTHLESFVGNIPGGMGGKYTGSPEREQQIRELETFCDNHMKRYPDLAIAMISGDLNWDDERVQSKGQDKVLGSVLSSHWKDTWFTVRDRRRQAIADRNRGKVKKKDEPTCFTYDSKESVMLGGTLRRRFDRILIRQRDGVKMHVEDIELIGKEPIEDLTWNKESTWNGKSTTKVVPVLPSDHFGYVASLNANHIN